MSDSVLDIEKAKKKFTLVELERLFDAPRDILRFVTAVDDVSLSVPRGKVYGFLGPNGAGKTTTIKMCMDLIRPTAGTVRIFGKDPRDPTVRARLGYLPEQPYFYDYLKPQEILDFFGRLFGLSRAERKKRTDTLLERVGLSEARNRSLRKFSKGMLQRLGIAQALINEPELLVLDEPFSGLDPMGRKEMRDIIIEQRNKGTTLFFSSHILSDIEHLCDRVAIVSKGRVVKEGVLDELLSPEQKRSELLVGGVGPELRQMLAELHLTLTDVGATASRFVVDDSRVGAVLGVVLKNGGQVLSMQPHRDSLEALFLREAGGGAL